MPLSLLEPPQKNYLKMHYFKGIEPTTNGLKVHTRYPTLDWLTRLFQFLKISLSTQFTPSRHSVLFIFAEQNFDIHKALFLLV